MMALYDVNNFAVDTILSEIKAGEIAMQEGKHPFVGAASKVRDLLDSFDVLDKIAHFFDTCSLTDVIGNTVEVIDIKRLVYKVKASEEYYF